MKKDGRNIVYEITIGLYKYIGSTCNIFHRINCHKLYLKKNTHCNSTMQNVWNKYQVFEYTILSEWITREEAYTEEQNLLNLYFEKPYYMMQNASAHGAAAGRVSPMKGRKWSDSHRAKMSGKNAPRYGINFNHSEETKESIRQKMVGKPKEKIKCPHCEKIGGNAIMRRWHFDNCKNKQFSNGHS